MCEIILGWDEVGQQIFCWACLITFSVCVYTIFYNIRILFRGYESTDDWDARDCNSNDNLTGHCINRSGNCETTDECDYQIRLRRVKE